jgi:hypothetical protein
MSGGDIPGEGEHKIIDWLRSWKQSKDYNINESHCIYSIDADLVFLSLSLHLPKMLILREVLKFNDSQVNSATKRTTEEQQMELLFINLLREYMELEYRVDEAKYTNPDHKFDIERIIDDFILFAMFIGNDFVHKLYCMSTKKGNFDEVIDIFKQTIPTLGGYLSDKGEINWKNFSTLLSNVTRIENKMIDTTLDQMEDYLRETKKSKTSLFVDDDHEDEDELMEAEEDRLPHHHDNEDSKPATKKGNQKKEGEEEFGEDDDENKGPLRQKKDYEDLDDEEMEAIETLATEKFDEDSNQQKQDKSLKKLDKNYELEYQLYYTKIKNEVQFIDDLLKGFKSKNERSIAEKKLAFYTKFFDTNLENVEHICMEYCKALQFVMYYYFYGCPSWDWYFPYFMSPLMSDLITVIAKNAPSMKFEFELGKPYKPFNQLAYILPNASLALLPPIYQQTLLSDPRTKIYYPTSGVDFQPFDGIHDYQWIAKVPHFDDAIMKEVLDSIDENKFSEADKRRNSRASEEIYKYNPKVAPLVVKSLQNGLPDFEERIEFYTFDLEKLYPFDKSKISYSMKGIDLNDGFPSLFIIPNVTAQILDISRKAKYKKLILTIDLDRNDGGKPQGARAGYKGYVFYDYPFKKIGYINTAVDEEGQYKVGNIESLVVDDILDYKRPRSSEEAYRLIMNDCTNNLYREKGIDYVTRESTHEAFYEIESRKSAWRTAMDLKGKIIYEFKNVEEIYPHGLLFPFSIEEHAKIDTQFKYPLTENDLFKPGFTCVSLFNGDMFQIGNKGVGDLCVYGDIFKPNNFQSKDVVYARELLEDQWRLVNNSLLAELGLKNNELLVLYGIMDSVIIKTDASKTSSLILGGMFDIGLRLMKALGGVADSRVQIITDLVKLIRNKPFDCSLPLKKGKGESVYYDVYLSPKGISIIADYFKTFPEVFDYMKKNVEKWNKKFCLPKVHDVNYFSYNRSEKSTQVLALTLILTSSYSRFTSGSWYLTSRA